MKNSYFEIKDRVLIVRSNISPRRTVSGFGVILFLIYLFVNTVILLSILINRRPLEWVLTFAINPFSLIIFIFIPIISFIIGRRLPPAAKVSFHYDTKTVKWQLEERFLEVPFEKIHFQKDLILSKSGSSSVGIAVSAIDDKPFFPTDTPKKNPDDTYAKVLWGFYCGTTEKADDMIETIKMFMDGKIDGSPSKFDGL